MFKYVSIRSIFRPPTALQLAVKELEQAERDKLEAHSGHEYAASMVKYHDVRITRLKQFIATNSQEVN